MDRHGQPHAAAAGAQVQHPASLACRSGTEDGPFGQHLCVTSGDEHVAGDIQREAIELPLPHDIGYRLPRQAALDQLLHPPLQLRRNIEGHVPVQLFPALVRGIAQQFPGLQLGGVDACLSQPRPGVQV